MDVRLPNLGEGADSGSVVSVMVKEGDEITQGQTLLELENEKAVAPIPSPAAGKVTAVRVKEGDKISVGQVILTIGESGAPSAKPKRPAKQETEPAPEPEELPESDESETEPADEGGDLDTSRPVAASPTVRKIARDLGIELGRVKGSQRGGRIVIEDLRQYIQKLQRLAFQKPAKAKKAAPASEAIDFSKWGPVQKKPVTSLRRTISQRMSESWNTIPHVTQFDEADVTDLMELRKKYAPAYEKQGAKLTLTGIALKVVAAALKKHPVFNASLDLAAEEIVFKEYCHIGLAVDTEAGLIVPVIRDVDKKSLLELSKELGALATKARDRKIALEELKGGSFTISNQGGIGGAHFTPIVNKPEVAILGIGRGAIKPGVKKGKIEPCHMLPLALSYDHRLIDGGQAARFITELTQAFENFAEADVKL